MRDDPAPTRLGRYRLVRKLGRGGMATVYSAVQEGPHGFENEVAIKLVHPNLLREHPQVVRMVVDEARVASRIRHPNVVRIMDLCEEPPDVLYIVMDYVDGVSMRQVLDTARALDTPPPRGPVLEVLAAACEGLHAAHQATQPDGTPLNLVHRDVKPGNILVSADGEVKVGDFGIAFFGDRLVESTGHGQMKGTPAYMSPEQVLGTPVDARSDIFSMGLTLYTLITARLAFAGETPMGMAMKIAQESLEPHAQELEEACPGLGDIFRTATAREPMARYPQAAAMAAALREVRETLRAKATVAEMVVASGWKPRAPDERPGEMASIDAKGTVVDLGPLARTPTPSVTDPFPDGEPETVGDEPVPRIDPGGRDEVIDLSPTDEGPAPVEVELLPPDPYARPVRAERPPRVETTGARPRVFAAGATPPPPGARPTPPPRTGRPGPGPRGAPPGPRPGPAGPLPGRPRPGAPRPGRPAPGVPGGPPGAALRSENVLERDYRGRVIRKQPVEEPRGIGLVEKVGVAVAFVLVLVAVWVIVHRGPTSPADPFADDGVDPEVAAAEEEAARDRGPRGDAFSAAAGGRAPGLPVAAPAPAVDEAALDEPQTDAPRTDDSRAAESPADEPEAAEPTAETVLPPEPPPAAGGGPAEERARASRAAASNPRERAVAPAPAEATPAPAIPAGTGRLTVNSYPWAEVHVDGKNIGNTPIVAHTLPAGPHRVRLVFTVPGKDGVVPAPVDKDVVLDAEEHEKVVHRGP